MPKTVVILAPSSVPFQVGGAEKLWWSMREALADEPDWWAELVKLPAPEGTFAEIVASYEMFSKIDLSHFDLLISTKYPAWMASHPRHVCYMQHTLRGLYDTYNFTGLPETLPHIPSSLKDLAALVRKRDATREDLPQAFELLRKAQAAKSLPSSLFAFPGPLIREVVHFFDRIALAPGQIKAWLAISANVASRKDYFPPGVSVTCLHHPSDLKNFYCENGEYFFTASRLNDSKRVQLLVDAMAYVKSDVKMRIAGTGPELKTLRERAKRDPRIEFLGHVPDAAMPGLYARAIAVPFAPYDEDYGLVSLEAMKSGKPVVTTRDAGGAAELVVNGENGFVVEPSAPALGHILDRLAKDRDLAAKMGQKGRQTTKHIEWKTIAPKLLAAAETAPRPKVVVACVFAADRHGTGGPRRLYNFCAELAKKYRVEIVCLGSKTLRQKMEECPAQGIRQTILPWPATALGEAEKLRQETGESADDIAILRTAHECLEIRETLRQIGADAELLIASHPWLYKAAHAALPHLPLAYDAHNVEADLKTIIFGKGGIACETAAAEGELARAALAVFACSVADRKRLANLYGVPETKVHVLPNGCEPDGRRLQKIEARRRLPYMNAKLALFLGSGHKPNVEAAEALFRIAAKTPEVQFLLAGSVSCQAGIRQLPKPPNLHLLGEVSEKVKRILLEAADLALNPVISGSGINLKIVEYLSLGIPCISTPFGMRGIPEEIAAAARVCMLENFPAAIRDCLANPPHERELAAAADSVLRAFAWPAALAPLVPTIASVLGNMHASDN